MDKLLALLYLARFRGVPTSTRDALLIYYQQQGIDPPLAVALPEAALQLAEYKYILTTRLSKMIYHQGASLSQHALLI